MLVKTRNAKGIKRKRALSGQKIHIRDRTEAELEVISKTGKTKMRKGKGNTKYKLGYKHKQNVYDRKLYLINAQLDGLHRGNAVVT